MNGIIKEVARSVDTPTKSVWIKHKQAINYMINTKDSELLIKQVLGNQNHKLQLFSDASHRNQKIMVEELKDIAMHSYYGYIIKLDGVPVKWKSTKTS